MKRKLTALRKDYEKDIRLVKKFGHKEAIIFWNDEANNSEPVGSIIRSDYIWTFRTKKKKLWTLFYLDLLILNCK